MCWKFQFRVPWLARSTLQTLTFFKHLGILVTGSVHQYSMVKFHLYFGIYSLRFELGTALRRKNVQWLNGWQLDTRERLRMHSSYNLSVFAFGRYSNLWGGVIRQSVKSFLRQISLFPNFANLTGWDAEQMRNGIKSLNISRKLSGMSYARNEFSHLYLLWNVKYC